jgi:hypothetical protein
LKRSGSLSTGWTNTSSLAISSQHLYGVLRQRHAAKDWIEAHRL